MREPSTCLEALCLNSREAEGFTVGVVGFEAIGGSSPLDSDRLSFASNACLILRDGLLEDFACREQRHFFKSLSLETIYAASIVSARVSR